jgi:hypothetical protein
MDAGTMSASTDRRLWAMALVRGSLGLVRAHPVVSLGIGAAVVLSLLAVPTGLGALLAPWFVCELFAVQLAMRGETPQARGRGWVSAASIVFLVVVVIAIAGWIAALGFGPDYTTADRSLAPLPLPEALRRGGLVAGTLALAVAAGTPFLYAPLVLLDRGGRLGGACLESAALVRRGGPLAHYALAFFAYLLSLSPALVSMIVIARTIERAATPLGALFALPLLPATIPLGLGLITHAYLELRDALPDAHALRTSGPLPRVLVAFLAVVSLAPLVGLLLMAIAGLVPSRPPIGRLPDHAVVVVDTHARSIVHVPDTTIAIELDRARAAVFAGDHDGVGPLPDAFAAAIDHVRVGRVADDFAIELAAADAVRVVRIDRAGLRVDDSVEARLRSRSPDSVLIAFVVCFAICALGALAYLGTLGEVRARRRARTLAYRRATLIALAVLPFSMMALAAGAIALFGLPG